MKYKKTWINPEEKKENQVVCKICEIEEKRNRIETPTSSKRGAWVLKRLVFC